MTHHVLRPHALCRALVMRAAGGMDMMISRVPTTSRRIDPALKAEVQRSAGRTNGNSACLGRVFGSAAAGHRKLAGWKSDGFAVGAVDLLLKKEIRCEPFGTRGINALRFILDPKGGHHRPSGLVADAHRDVH